MRCHALAMSIHVHMHDVMMSLPAYVACHIHIHMSRVVTSMHRPMIFDLGTRDAGVGVDLDLGARCRFGWGSASSALCASLRLRLHPSSNVNG